MVFTKREADELHQAVTELEKHAAVLGQHSATATLIYRNVGTLRRVLFTQVVVLREGRAE